MRFSLIINMDNAAFESPKELPHLLRAVTYRVEYSSLTEGTVRDINGSTVGSWDIR